ncbi:beta-lactamase domain-containing protein [Fictibacillus macauensis ZFHKF-1]|uniref:Beta-lactamase domain-containing protein n=1 Tax=Fictibacillus macauensis ZFHKF-1 TaxID=1196324 RepID=I8UKE0_9BACL|nr:MBL fold metallo-hydrolase [Fictibacillus macauensis]EIT87293.1 beta-lactamase domain-containing protein [Fictibacillus macauensis ZFHKF-1]
MKEKIITIELPTPFHIGAVNVYLLVGDTITLIDCGPKTKEAWTVFTEQLHHYGYRESDIEQLVLTHYHPDHVGMYAYFSEPPTVFAPADEMVYLQRDSLFLQHRTTFFTTFYKQMGVPPKLIEGEQKKLAMYAHYASVISAPLPLGPTLPCHPDWQVLKTPGHSPDHRSFYHKDSGTLLGGDCLLPHVSSTALMEPPLHGETVRLKPILHYRQSLRMLRSLPVTLLYPGHRLPFSNVSTLIDERLHLQEKRASSLLLALQSPQTPYELSQLLFPKIYTKDLHLTISETVALLDLLEEQQLVERQEHEHTTYYVQKEGVEVNEAP